MGSQDLVARNLSISTIYGSKITEDPGKILLLLDQYTWIYYTYILWFNIQFFFQLF